jgi:hypothetical protein
MYAVRGALVTMGSPPARAGGVEIKNRVVMPQMTTRTADDDGCVTEATIAYYAARAESGVGLIAAEMASPERAGHHRRRELGIYDDRFFCRGSRGLRTRSIAAAQRRRSSSARAAGTRGEIFAARGRAQSLCSAYWRQAGLRDRR